MTEEITDNVTKKRSFLHIFSRSLFCFSCFAVLDVLSHLEVVVKRSDANQHHHVIIGGAAVDHLYTEHETGVDHHIGEIYVFFLLLNVNVGVPF